MARHVTALARCPHCTWFARSSRETVAEVVVDLEARAREHVTQDHQRPAATAIGFTLEHTEVRLRLDNDSRLERDPEARGQRLAELSTRIVAELQTLGVPLGDLYASARRTAFHILADDLYGNASIDIPGGF